MNEQQLADALKITVELALAKHEIRTINLLCKDENMLARNAIEYNIFGNEEKGYKLYLGNSVFLHETNNLKKLLKELKEEWLGPFTVFQDGEKLFHKLDYTSKLKVRKHKI